jgi:hypothetical protein
MFMEIDHEHDYDVRMLRITNLVTVRNFVVTPRKHNTSTVGIRNTENYAHEY